MPGSVPGTPWKCGQSVLEDPIGATGGRILATRLHELRRRGGRYGLETMCVSGGQGLAAVFENAQTA